MSNPCLLSAQHVSGERASERERERERESPKINQPPPGGGSCMCAPWGGGSRSFCCHLCSNHLWHSGCLLYFLRSPPCFLGGRGRGSQGRRWWGEEPNGSPQRGTSHAGSHGHHRVRARPCFFFSAVLFLHDGISRSTAGLSVAYQAATVSKGTCKKSSRERLSFQFPHLSLLPSKHKLSQRLWIVWRVSWWVGCIHWGGVKEGSADYTPYYRSDWG